MIEQYFRSGVRFLWNKPGDNMGAMNGDIIPSVGAATNLTYDGLDGHQATVLGLAMNANVPYTWLDYAPCRSAYVPIAGNDILSGYMSGCLILHGAFGGAISACHVGTITGNSVVNQRVKQRLAQNLPVNATGFNPAGAWTPGEVAVKQAQLGGGAAATPQVIALVTAAGAFYSILLFNVNQGGWTNPAGRR